MKLALSENIRAFRKQRKLTQEKLAEALGVTVGAVYKWESGLSQPELVILVELADFFDTSVDALLGYRVRDNRLDAALERLISLCGDMDPSALTEAEKILGKYPHSFKAVYTCAEIILGFSAMDRDPAKIRRAMELLEQARVLLPQNDDPAVSEVTICGSLAGAHFMLGEKEKSIELLQKNNPGGIFNSEIGLLRAVYMERPEEAVPVLADALVNSVSGLITAIISYVFVFRSRGDWASALDITTWGADFMAGLKTENTSDSLGKTHAEILVLLAYAQLKSGLREEASASLKKARAMEQRFDSRPNYNMESTRFAGLLDQPVILLDVFSGTEAGGISGLIFLLGDRELSEQWKELTENEQ